MGKGKNKGGAKQRRGSTRKDKYSSQISKTIKNKLDKINKNLKKLQKNHPENTYKIVEKEVYNSKHKTKKHKVKNIVKKNEKKG